MPRIPKPTDLRTRQLAGGMNAAKINPGVAKEYGRAGAAWGNAIQAIGGAFSEVASRAAAAQDGQNYALAQMEFNKGDNETWNDLSSKADSQGNGFEQTAPRYQKLMETVAKKYPISDPTKRRQLEMSMLDRSTRRGFQAAREKQNRLRTHFRSIEDRQFTAATALVAKSPNAETIQSQLEPLEELVRSGNGVYHGVQDVEKRIQAFRGELYKTALTTLAQKDPEAAAKLFEQIQKQGRFEAQQRSSATVFAGGKRVPTNAERREIFKSGGVVVNLDTNWSKGGQTSPMVVIPDGATKAQRQAAEAYAQRIAEVYKQQFGKSLKPRVVTRSQNGRGRTATIHTEPFAVTDSKAVKFFQSPEGLKAHAQILQSTLGKIPGVQFSIPHNPGKGDNGAEGSGTNEVALARELLGHLGSKSDTQAPGGYGRLAEGQSFEIDTKFGKFSIDSQSWNSLSASNVASLASFAQERKGQARRMMRAEADQQMQDQIAHMERHGTDAKGFDRKLVAQAYSGNPQKIARFNARMQAAQRSHAITQDAASLDISTLHDRLLRYKPQEGDENYAIQQEMYDKAQKRVDRLARARDNDPALSVDGSAGRETWGRNSLVDRAYKELTAGYPQNSKEWFAVVDARLRAQKSLGVAQPKPLTNREASALTGELKMPEGGDPEAAARNLMAKVVDRYGETHAEKIVSQVIDQTFKDEERRELFRHTLDDIERREIKRNEDRLRLEREQEMLRETPEDEGGMLDGIISSTAPMFRDIMGTIASTEAYKTFDQEVLYRLGGGSRPSTPIPPDAIKELQSRPDTAAMFERAFGLPPGGAKKYLQKQGQ